MSADDRREELEAAVWRELTRAPMEQGQPSVCRILAAADAYATALAAETVDGIIREGRARGRRDSLAERVRTL
jgi:hypothetical protein